jgi:hypothetical protein
VVRNSTARAPTLSVAAIRKQDTEDMTARISG